MFKSLVGDRLLFNHRDDEEGDPALRRVESAARRCVDGDLERSGLIPREDAET
jgi:hypothetical protein